MSVSSIQESSGEKKCPNCGYKLIMIGTATSCTMCGFKQSPKGHTLSLEERMEQLESKVNSVGSKINFILFCFIIPFVLFYLVLPFIFLFSNE